MLFLKRGLMAAGALALAAMLLNFVAPKSVHAAVATLVQVVNTAATPVPTLDTGAPGRHPYSFSCSSSANGCVTARVPAGFTYVNDSISYWASTGGGASFTAFAGGNYAFAYLPASPLGSYYAFAANFTFYADAGSFITVGNSGTDVTAFFIGHLVPTP